MSSIPRPPEPGSQLSLLPEPGYCPRQPSPNTLEAKCLKLMQEGKHLNHPSFQAITGSWRLAAVVYDLTCLGWPIERTDIRMLSDFGPRSIRSYWIAQPGNPVEART